MERTPSPPRRLHTPPAPLHGAKHDKYEPYSPRRSSRVAAQHKLNQQQSSPTRSRLSRGIRESTPTSSKKKPAARSSLQGLSPPSSPISPDKLRSPRSTRRIHFEDTTLGGDSESDLEHTAPTPATRFLSAMNPHSMLPTPDKTPRKRPLKSQESLSSTARVLFPSRPATVEDAMPTPRKGRKSMKNVYSLESFAAQMDEDGKNSSIQIYTDSKERIPTADEEEDNPFVTKKGKSKAKANGASKARKVDAKTARMEEGVDQDEGMIYMFRGKKTFRKFHDGPPSNGSEEEPELSEDEVRRQAGAVSHRPLTRASIKPRLLFQEEIKQLEREMDPDDADEEAVTDIEIPVATPSNRKSRKTTDGGGSVHHQEATPPTTTRKTRRKLFVSDPGAMEVDHEVASAFDSWSRVKSTAHHSSSSESRKRAGDHLESAADKRTRSEPSSPMRIDSV